VLDGIHSGGKSMVDFQRGSEWRRWDLHLHTPETNKNDNFKGESIDEKWDNFYISINDYIGDGTDSNKNIAVVGITDYLSIDNYKKVVADNKLPASISLVLPNVEMRMLPVANDSPINIHFIFNPAVENGIESRFLAKLSFSYKDSNYSAARAELIRLGKEINNELDDKGAYKKGVEQFIPSFEKIKEIFTNDTDLRHHTIILVSNSSTDGVSGAVNHSDYFDTGDGHSQLDAVRQSIYKFVDGLFSAKPSDIAFFSGLKENCPPNLVANQCGSLKPCVHGSDAHENFRIFEPDQQRYCWIKADPTFNGLRQIIYEPVDRIRISDTKPEEKVHYQIIDSVSFINNKCFQKEPILLNQNLNCIIGGKSTGKSLLLHNIAMSIAPEEVDKRMRSINDVDRVEGKKNTPSAPEIDVKWFDSGDTKKRKITYIPQKYLNRLADYEESTTEIDNIIKEIVLSKTDSDGELLQITEDRMRANIDYLLSDGAKKLIDIVRYYDSSRDYESKMKELGDEILVEQEIKRLEDEIRYLSAKINFDEKEFLRYDEIICKLSEEEKLIQNLPKDIDTIQGLEEVFCVDGISLHDEKTLALVTDVLGDLEKKANELWKKERDTILADIKGRIDFAEKEVERLTIEKGNLQPKIESNNELKEKSKQIASEKEKLLYIKNLSSQKKQYDDTIERLISDVAQVYACGLKLRSDEYSKHIGRNSNPINSDLTLETQVRMRNKDFIEKWREIYGVQKKNTNRIKQWLEGEIDDDEAKVKYETDFIIAIINDTLSGSLVPLKNKTPHEALSNILANWFTIKYVVKMENDNIDSMSPGKKALVLLKLLVELADSAWPILIDQPEDDLDNRSIYDQLIGFIKTKKITRQIIIVTHNANIVVGADAEEVIIANQIGNDSPNKERKFEYRSGSIENDKPLYKSDGKTIEAGVLNSQGIQQHICAILEGGEKAFELRKHKYHI